MSESASTISVKLLDRDFEVKCPPDKIADLQESAAYLDTKMREVADGGKVQSLDRIAAIAALNITHELKSQKQQSNQYMDTISQRIQALQSKIETELVNQNPPTQEFPLKNFMADSSAKQP